MTSTRPSTPSMITAAAAFALAVSGCGGDGDSSAESLPEPDATTTTTTIVSLVTAEPEPAAEPAGESAADPEPEPEPAPEPPGDGSCLIGNWKISDVALNSCYDALAAGSGAGSDLSMDTTGEVLISFTESDYLYVGDFDLALSVGGQEATGIASGTVDGTWAADEGIIVTELGSSNLNVVVNVAGITMDGSDLGNSFVQVNPINDAPFDCDGPTLMFQSGPGPSMRHPVKLTPA